MARKQLKEDLAVLKQTCDNDDHPISNIDFDDDSLSFSFNAKGDELFLNLYCGDYPQVMWYPEDGEPKEYKGRLCTVVELVVTDICKKRKFSIPDLGFPATEDKSSNLKKSKGRKKGRKALVSSVDSLGSEEEYMDEDETIKVDPLLLQDIEFVKAKFGSTSISAREYAGIDTMDIELHIDISFLGDFISQAWNVDRFTPITVRIALIPSIYLQAGAAPKVEILQMNHKSFGISSQLTAIMTEFVKHQWQIKDSGRRENLPGQQQQQNVQNEKNGNSTQTQKSGKGGYFSSIKGMFGKSDKMDIDDDEIQLPPIRGRDADVAALMEMGFNLEQCTNACRLASTMEESLNLLLSNPESCTNKSMLATQKDLLTKKKSSTHSHSQKQISNNPQTEWELAEIKAEDAKQFIPTRTQGFLVMIMLYIRQRIPALSNYCVICDRAHVFANGAMLKPAVCSRELCCWSFQKLGVMSDAADDIATEAEVVDLLVCMATAAAKSQRANDIFDPYPTLFDPNDPKKAVFNPNSKDFQYLQRVLNSFPTVQKMSQASSCVDMRMELDKADKFAYPLLQWLISSNRSHIVKIPPKKHIKSMNTPFQYVLISAAPEKQKAFDEAKAIHGSTFAFHGSKVENWHSILRNGLKNASGTKLQVNGAAYGAGIYLSPDSATSFGYSGISAHGGNRGNSGGGSGGSGERRFLSSSNFVCIAICEVIEHSSMKKSGSIWVMPEANYVITRFFFVYDVSSMKQSTMPSTNTPSFVDEIKNAMHRD